MDHLPTSGSAVVSTTVHLRNLHCSSCVATIEGALQALSPAPLHIDVSIVLQSVTIRHYPILRIQAIYDALRDAGFELLIPESSSLGTMTPSLTTQQEKHLKNCSQCQEDFKRAQLDLGPAPFSGGDLLSSYTPPFSQDEKSSLVLSVGGMTCSACTSTLTEALCQIGGVSDVSISLLDHSAKMVVEGGSVVKTIQDTIDDCGYDSRLISLEPIPSRSNEKTTKAYRTISLRVDGMYCQHCPQKVISALTSFGDEMKVVKPFTVADPILTITYPPSSPYLNIRTIIATLVSANEPSFKVTVYHPPTIEELSKLIQLREQRAYLLRLFVAFIAAIPSLIIGIVYMTLVNERNPIRQFFMEPMWVGNVSRAEWALFFISTPVMFYSASIFHRRSLKEIWSAWRPGSTVPFFRRFYRFGSMNLLVSSAISVAYFSSVALLALSATTPSSGHMGDTTTYFDSVVFLAMFLLCGRYLEAYSKARTADAISALSSLRPAEALLVVPMDDYATTDSKSRPEKAERISIDLLEVGDVVRVPHGSTPPADGFLLENQETSFDESSLTGESKPVPKQGGDSVFLGTINKGQPVLVRVGAVEGGTMLDNIVKVVREGQSRRAPIERVADIITSYFVPVVTLLAILTWVIWLSLGLTGILPQRYLDIKTGGWPVWSLQFAIAVFVIACPCGIGLAAPTALLVGLGLAAKNGILARGGGEAFQEMSQLDVIVFDKTGTLTQGGEPKVTGSDYPESRWTREDIHKIAAELESASSHPLALAVRNFCESKAKGVTASNIEEVAGRGLKATFPALDLSAFIGSEQWMIDNGASISTDLQAKLNSWKSEAKSVVLLALRDVASDTSVVAAAFAISDPLRPEARLIISWFQEQGIETWMISGDNPTTAAAVAKQVGIPLTNVFAGVLPHEKSQKIQVLQQSEPIRRGKLWSRRSNKSRSVVAMVGDGINDAPALTIADVGIAIGSGSDVAISSAGFVLLSSDLSSLVILRDLSKRVINRVKFNFIWALMYNSAALPIAAGVVYPAGYRLDPVWASLAMALSSVSVVCSSLLLRLYKAPRAFRDAEPVKEHIHDV
ncbi:heavy metal translocatin [Pluteus cervinus]|uniref:Heavy metal translocatin n=1 Tax=Pluteus cervinus TaxID=181527 RepID=A0ACD3BDJ3_9AGAR|nr:heavy metal translocatin [Pluteus cervinus]